VCGLVRSVRLRWIEVNGVWVRRARRLMIQLLLLGLTGDFLRRIHGCRVSGSRGMVSWFEYRGQVRTSGRRVELLLVFSGLCLLVA
jgi:hypothetical protein